MWKIINNEEDLLKFFDQMNGFHDSCIKEIRYYSGAYVDEDLSMYPINDRRSLLVLLHQQNAEHPIIEMEFEKLKFLHLSPISENYTCEILDATVMYRNGTIYWADSGNLSYDDLEGHSGTVICADMMRWRTIKTNPNKDRFNLSSDNSCKSHS